MTTVQNESGEFGVSGQDQPAAPARPEGHVGQTGPKTAWGKARSSQNAIKHGLCADPAKNAIIDGEDLAELAAMHEEFLADERDGVLWDVAWMFYTRHIHGLLFVGEVTVYQVSVGEARLVLQESVI